MKTSINEKKFSKIKKLRIKFKNFESKKKSTKNKTKLREKDYNESCICETKYD